MSLLNEQEPQEVAVENNDSIQRYRYARADLLAIRNDDYARERPSCASRTELQSLHFWKNGVFQTNFGTNAYINKNSLASETENSPFANSNGLISTRRSLRNRERVNSYYQRIVTTDESGGDPSSVHILSQSTSGLSINTPYKSPNIDHRSISSSHLMPAFAKRRIVVTAGPVAEANELQNEKCDTLSNPENDTPGSKERIPPHIQATNTEIKYPVRSTINSPTHKSTGSSEWERCEKRLSQQSFDRFLEASPTHSATRHSNSTQQERRIGSGRLLPRDDNWEFKGRETDSALAEKDRTPCGNNNNHLRQRAFNGRPSEKLAENVLDRRNNERRGPDIRESYDGKRSSQGRRSSNKDKSSFVDSSNQCRGKRMNLYQTHDRNEEPEWFSAGPTSQLETIDLHGFEDLETNEGPSDLESPISIINKSMSVNKSTLIETETPKSNDSNVNLSDQINSDALINSHDETSYSENLISEQISPTVPNDKNLKPSSHSESEFNFDVFLNLDPMDHTLMGNDSEVRCELTGTSRFSQWFGKTSQSDGSDIPNKYANIVDTHGIPSVKDLEAQMTKVNLRHESCNPLVNLVKDSHLLYKEDIEKPIIRDTEGFKKLLQQLGACAQENAQSTSGNTNLTHNTNHLVLSQQNPQSRNDIQKGYQLQSRQNERLLTNHPMDMSSHTSSLHSFAQMSSTSSALPLEQSMHDFTTPSVLPIQTHKRMDTQHLLQNLPAGPNVQIQNLHAQHCNSPTPLAFTPTSVLRKMTADKDATPLQNNANINQQCQYQQSSEQNKQIVAHNVGNTLQQPSPPVSSHPRMILGGNYAMHHQFNPSNTHVSQLRITSTKWAPNMHNTQGSKSMGRPILKGPPNCVSPQIPNAAFAQKMDMQQFHQQRFKSIQTTEPIINNEHIIPGGTMQNYQYTEGAPITQIPHHYIQQTRHPRHRIQIYSGENRQLNVPRMPPSTTMGAPDNLETINFGAINYHREDRVSPTPNQFAQWFSPELLARASAGKLPLLNMNQALSLEEFERNIQHSSAAVHN